MNTLRTRALPLARTRFLSTSPLSRKSAVDAAKDTVKSADRTISDAAVKGIEKGEQAAASVKSTIGINASKAEGAASETTGDLKGKAGQSTGDLKGKANQSTGDLKGKASEVTGEAKGKAQEVAGAAKGKAEEVKSKI
ncbi:MAG: hypothetical protein Q9170_004385 [Blastenia crenularia]